MHLNYPGPTGPFPARAPESETPAAAQPVTIIALCDGTAIGFEGQPNLDVVARANADAGARLVERIAKRVVEMQAPQVFAGAGTFTKPSLGACGGAGGCAAQPVASPSAIGSFQDAIAKVEARMKTTDEPTMGFTHKVEWSDEDLLAVHHGSAAQTEAAFDAATSARAVFWPTPEGTSKVVKVAHFGQISQSTIADCEAIALKEGSEAADKALRLRLCYENPAILCDPPQPHESLAAQTCAALEKDTRAIVRDEIAASEARIKAHFARNFGAYEAISKSNYG